MLLTLRKPSDEAAYLGAALKSVSNIVSIHFEPAPVSSISEIAK